MKRSRHVIHGQAAARAEKLRKLITALQFQDLRRAEIGILLQVSLSAVRKYLRDLRDLIEFVGPVNMQFCRLKTTKAETLAYLANLDAAATVRPAAPSKSALSIATRDPRRHIHVMEDDVHYAIRLHRGPVARDPMVAALFGPGAPVAMLPSAFCGQRAATELA